MNYKINYDKFFNKSILGMLLFLFVSGLFIKDVSECLYNIYFIREVPWADLSNNLLIMLFSILLAPIVSRVININKISVLGYALVISLLIVNSLGYIDTLLILPEGAKEFNIASKLGIFAWQPYLSIPLIIFVGMIAGLILEKHIKSVLLFVVLYLAICSSYSFLDRVLVAYATPDIKKNVLSYTQNGSVEELCSLKGFYCFEQVTNKPLLTNYDIPEERLGIEKHLKSNESLSPVVKVEGKYILKIQLEKYQVIVTKVFDSILNLSNYINLLIWNIFMILLLWAVAFRKVRKNEN